MRLTFPVLTSTVHLFVNVYAIALAEHFVLLPVFITCYRSTVDHDISVYKSCFLLYLLFAFKFSSDWKCEREDFHMLFYFYYYLFRNHMFSLIHVVFKYSLTQMSCTALISLVKQPRILYFITKYSVFFCFCDCTHCIAVTW